MNRNLTVLFRRDPTRDHEREKVRFQGYQVYWPDGRPVQVGLEAFCRHGQRLFGLGRKLSSCSEALVELICYPLHSREDDITRLPGCRVRRFCLERNGSSGRIHFMDGTPTAVVFDLHQDEWPVLDWIGLPMLDDGERLWLDLAVRSLEPVTT